MHDQGQACLGPKLTPALDVGPRQRIFDKADHGELLQLRDDGSNDARRAAVVEVPMQAESGWRDVLSGLRLLDDVVAGIAVHLEDAVALRGGAFDFAGEDLGRTGARPGADGHGVSHLLPHQLVGGRLEVFAHGIVERHAKGGAEVVVEEVERAVVHDGVHLCVVDGPAFFLTSVADNAVVGGDPYCTVLIDVVHPKPAGFVLVAPGQRYRDRDDVDVRDFHGVRPGEESWQVDEIRKDGMRDGQHGIRGMDRDVNSIVEVRVG